MNRQKRGEHIATVISLTELGYPKPTWDDAVAIVRGLNRDAAFIVLAQFNLFLSVASIQSQQSGGFQKRRWAQEKLISNVTSESRLAEIRAKVGDADLVDRILLHRNFTMAALRLAATHAQTDGGNRLENIDDFSALGELALVINAITEPDEAQQSPCDMPPGLHRQWSLRTIRISA